MTEYRPDELSSTANCCQCGHSVPHDQVISYDNHIICAACKPVFVQKLKEGVSIKAQVNCGPYGGFWIRLLAKILDHIIVNIVQWGIALPLKLILTSMRHDAGYNMVILLYMLVNLAIPVFYHTFFIGRWGATLGKSALGLEVVSPEGERISYMRAFGRFWAEIISGFPTLGIGYIMAGFNDEKKTLHDIICSTRVIRRTEQLEAPRNAQVKIEDNLGLME